MSSAAGVCETDACGKPASLRCPTCKKLGVPGGWFCEQKCFQGSWKQQYVYFQHDSDEERRLRCLSKLIHKLFQAALASAPAEPRQPSYDFSGYRFTGPLRAADVTAMRSVPSSIPRPDYAGDGIPRSEMAERGSTKIHVNTPEQIEKMRVVGRAAREIMDAASAIIAPGVTTDEIDAVVHEETIKRGAYPSPLNYHNFPKSVCTSVNEVICHGIPDTRPLKNGDIVNLDITAYLDGHHADFNETYLVGDVDDESVRLVKCAYESLRAGVSIVKPGVMYREIGEAISKVAKKENFTVVKSYCGHGVNQLFHTSPNVPHYRRNKTVGVVRPGHTFTIEPMINAGTHHDETWPDGWTAVTQDGKRSAQFEHTMLSTETGVDILTALPDTDPTAMPEWNRDFFQRG